MLRFKPSLARVGLLLSGLCWLALALPALAALSEAQVVSLIERAKILPPDSRVQAVVAGNEVALSAYRHPKATDKDCKIDAILTAKTLMDADPTGITAVKVRFYDPTNRRSYREVNVGTGVVKAFGEGRVSQEELLSSVVVARGEQDIERYRTMSYRDISRSPEVVDGIYRSERLNLLSRIQMLRDKGVGVQPFLNEFFKLEDKVRQHDDAAVGQAITFLDQKLHEQEQRVKQAQAPRQSAGASPYPGPSGLGPRGPGYPGPGGPPFRGPGDPGYPGPGGAPLPGAGVYARVRQELGDLAPRPGPMYGRRYRIARRILDMQEEGKIVDRHRRTLREIEELAERGDLETLRLKLTVTEHLLGLPSVDEE